MGVGDEIAVVDAGPLIHLAEIDALPTLNVFSRLHLPQVVWAETVEQGRVAAEGLADLQLARHSLIPAEVAQFVQTQALMTLQLGEQECLLLCKQLAVPILLTDDLAARDAAKRLGLLLPRIPSSM